MRYILGFCLLLSGYLSPAQVFDTCYIHFGIGVHTPDKAAAAVLQQVADSLSGPFAGNKILIYGYADYLGSQVPNKTLSQQRADAVAAFLKRSGVSADRFLVVKGLGRQEEKGIADEVGNAGNRKAMILIARRRSFRASDAPPRRLQEMPVSRYAVQYIPGTDTLRPETRENMEYLLSRIDHTPEDSAFVLEHIYFELHKDVILPKSIHAMQGLLLIMQHYPDLKIVIEGHICCNEIDGNTPGTPAYQLSVLRAKRIYTYLVSNHIVAERLQYKGFGRTRPVFAEEKDIAEMEANRRVEIRIRSK